jgi:hypothetical protein
METPFSPAKRLNETDVSQHANLDVPSPRCVWDESKLPPRAPEDEIVFRRWRLGFFVFYGAMALLLVGGLAAIADRPGTITTAATAAYPAIASTAAKRPRN